MAELIAGCVAIAFVGVLVTGAGDAAMRELLSNAMRLAAPLAAGAACMRASRRPDAGTTSRSWALLGAASLAWAAGQLVWGYDLVAGDAAVHVPSAADIGFFSALPLAIVALIGFPFIASTGATRLRIGLDGLVVACSLLVVAWVLGLGDAWRDADGHVLDLVLGATYPICNLALATVVLSAVPRARDGSRILLSLVGGALLLQAVSDAAFLWTGLRGDYAPGSLIDAGWVVARLLLFVAALRPATPPADDEERASVPQMVRVVLPYAAVGIAALVVLAQLITDHEVDSLVVGIGLGALVLLVVRQLLMLFENFDLTRVLATKLDELGAREEELRFRAFHDPLTGLGNRTLFSEQVDEALERSRSTGETFAVLFLDLDDFKTVNDSLGHAVGDELLMAVAKRIESCVRPGDVVARLGGDEFAALLQRASEADAEAVAERLVEVMRPPAQVHGREVYAHVSVGLACGRPNESNETVLGNADVALYAAKDSGKATYRVFEPVMRAAVTDRLELKADLQRALERRELVLSYQPIVSLATRETVAVEALVRWDHPDRGLLAPEMFVGLAEETGLIVPIGRAILQQACAQAATWRAASTAPTLVVNVNLSARQLQRPTLVDEVRETLAETGLDPSGLVLEITESVLMHHDEVTLDRLVELKALGVRLAIDDFGTGYSSLNYLRLLPVDILKIDKAFTDRIGDQPEDIVLLRAIIQLGQSLGVETVAEGIERGDQAAELLALGCDRAQGYHFARPGTPEEIDFLLRIGERSRIEPVPVRL